MTAQRWKTLAIIPAALVVTATAGCTGGGEPSESASASPSVTSTQQRWQRGEFTRDLRLCSAIPPNVLRGLRPDQSASAGGCKWESEHENDDPPAVRDVNVDVKRYVPPPARPHHTATQEARHEFGKPDGWQYDEGTPLRGYGDQAKISRRVDSITWTHTVRTAIRVRNLVIIAETTAGPDSVADDADVLRIPSLGDLQRTLLAVDQAMLKQLGMPARPAGAPARRSGEVGRVRDVCGAGNAADLTSGGKRTRVAPKGMVASCGWRRDDDTVTVNVEAVPPGSDGMSGTRLATVATGRWRADGDRQKTADVGDRAILRTYDGGDVLRDVTLSARSGNLLVHVGIERWHSARTAKQLRGDVVRIAKDVIHDHR